MKFISASDIGLVRSENQDNVYVAEIEGNVLAVLCDGMGGESSGSEASKIAVEAMTQNFRHMYRKEFKSSNIRNLLLSSASAANAAIYGEACDNPEKSGMGTTCVTAFVTENKIHIVNIGDSRAYIYDGLELKQITNDHTVVNMLFSQGKITEAEVENHPQRNMLVKAVGVEKNVFPDYFELDNPEHFRLVLCSDGLSGYCSAAEIENTLKNSSFENSADELIELAIGKGGRDNVTVAVIAE